MTGGVCLDHPTRGADADGNVQLGRPGVPTHGTIYR